MQTQNPQNKHLVFVGGGHTHALVLNQLSKKPLTGASITLINPGSKAPYTGMLPGFVAGHYDRSDVEIDLIRLARAANARIILDKVVSIDPDTATLQLAKRPPIGFDFASINVGITSHLPNLPGFAQFGHPAKPLSRFATGWQAFTDQIAADNKPLPISVIGGGIAGVELALTMSHRILTLCGQRAPITIIEQSEEMMRGTHPRTRTRLLVLLNEAGITCLTGAKAIEICEGSVKLDDGRSINSAFTVGAAGATPHDWIAASELATKDGFIVVEETLTSTSHQNIFASGDCAHFQPQPLPKAGVYAVRQAPVLYQNLKAALNRTSKKPFKPQKNFLKLISAGPKAAVADRFGIPFSGPLIWKWKDHIDRSFMERLDHFPKMAAEHASGDIPAPPMLCGGCGAKMASDALAHALTRLPPPAHKDVVSGPSDDAAILKHGHGYQVLSTDHLRAFTGDPWLMGQIAAVHALGDIWAMGAAPQSVLATIILPNLSDTMQSDMLTHILDGAQSVIGQTGADIVGGHTSTGAELTVGFSVTGLRQTAPISNSGATGNDVLILTKPIGVGTILAAEMQGCADGYDVEAAYAQMATPVSKAAMLLRDVATAMTDVTGFGLAGHLMTMMRASNTQALLNLDKVPCLQSAEKLANKGIRSSIWEANRRTLPDLPLTTPKAILLFDPQTAGGLLASIPASEADSTLAAFEKAGEDIWVIGKVTEGPGGITIC